MGWGFYITSRNHYYNCFSADFMNNAHISCMLIFLFHNRYFPVQASTAPSCTELSYSSYTICIYLSTAIFVATKFGYVIFILSLYVLVQISENFFYSETFYIYILVFVQVRLRTEVLRTPSSTRLGFELMTSRS